MLALDRKSQKAFKAQKKDEKKRKRLLAERKTKLMQAYDPHPNVEHDETEQALRALARKGGTLFYFSLSLIFFLCSIIFFWNSLFLSDSQS